MAGRVTAVDRAGEAIGSIRVDAPAGAPLPRIGAHQAVLRITPRTAVFRGDSSRARLDALATGQWVRVWVDGPVRESYPVQATATAVAIDSAAANE
jgi:hypothetical protein